MSEREATLADGERLTASRRWRLRDSPGTVSAHLADELGLRPVTGAVLAGRGLTTPEEVERFLAPGLDELHSPFAFRQMEAVVDRLAAALRGRERIVVHGDYDVDGITGTVLLVTVLRHLGADAELILPHRIDDGYGLNPSGVRKAADLGARVLIAVDCGVTAFEAAEEAARLGIDLIVVDHHVPRDELPAALAIINPRLPDAGYPEDNLAAVGVAFKVARALLERQPGQASGLSMLKLVALGTVADMVPLRGENRTMTFHGLAGIPGAVNPGLRWLLRVAGVDGGAVSSADVGFRLAPRINAAGRIDHPATAAELFMTTDDARARRLAGRLDKLNAERQELERDVLDQAIEQAPGDDDRLVVAAGDGWHRGVVGIVAARLVERWARPALVVAIEGDNAYGSARSVPGFDIVGALREVSSLLSDWGGHRQAAGFRLPSAGLAEFHEALLANARSIDLEALRPDLVCDAELDVAEIDLALALELERLAPFGVGNPRPRLLCRDVDVARPPQTLKEKHMKLFLRGAEGEIEAVGWRRGDWVEPLVGADRVSLVATLRARRWGGRITPQLEIEDLCA